jgi:hypothetical protein
MESFLLTLLGADQGKNSAGVSFEIREHTQPPSLRKSYSKYGCVLSHSVGVELSPSELFSPTLIDKMQAKPSASHLAMFLNFLCRSQLCASRAIIQKMR